MVKLGNWENGWENLRLRHGDGVNFGEGRGGKLMDGLRGKGDAGKILWKLCWLGLAWLEFFGGRA